MDKPYIVVGDKTSSGGVVISGAATSTINGKPMARVGDKATCPKHKGVFAIRSGDPDFEIDGRSAARHGDKLDCGCILLASQILVHDTNASDDEGAAASATSGAGASMSADAIAAIAPDICLDCLKKAAASGSAMVVRG